MAEILITSQSKVTLVDEIDQPTAIDSTPNFKTLIEYLFKKGDRESDINYLTLIIINQNDNIKNDNKLDKLDLIDKKLLLKYYFSHLNILVLEVNQLDSQIIQHINRLIVEISRLCHDRISRIQTWTGTSSKLINDQYDEEQQKLEDILFTMSSVLNFAVNKLTITKQAIVKIKDTIISEIDFFKLLSNNSTSHLLKLCNLVGHWSFPAHELSNDDLVYCVYLILKYCLEQINHALPEIFKTINMSNNELLGMIFMVRDTYKNGNPFHNFRHAVDVLQACFHYVIRLGFLPSFTQFQTNPNASDLLCLHSEKFGNAVELMPMKKLKAADLDDTNLNLIQTLSLLVAALGHDVGHPGVTNQFMIKHSLPTSILFNERSVLELFHTSVFLNKIMVINWPQFLSLKIDDDSNITVKELIITCILATDMAEHFDYIDKLNKFNIHHNSQSNLSKVSLSAMNKPGKLDIDDRTNQIKLISCLLIKCADISNVTRPLRVSAQWALVLSREFDEVLKLEEKINDDTLKFDIRYDEVPEDLNDVLEANPALHKGQIFFINTFAENLFNNIVELLPPLKFTGDIVGENKKFWQQR